MKDKTRVLVVGLGSIGQRHAMLLSERHDVELFLCESIDEQRSQTKASLIRPAAGEYADLRMALNAKPDIVFICVPNQFHVSVGLQALAARADIFVEKPVSDAINDARKLVEAAKAAGRFMQVGYMLRLDDGLIRMKKLVDDGAIGTLVGGRAMIGTYVTLLNAKSPDREYIPNSLIFDYTHELDFIRWFFGDLQTVKAMSASLGDLRLKAVPNICQMILKMKSGALVQVHMDYIQFPQRRIFEIYGDRGTLSYDFMTGQMGHFHHQREHQWEDISVSPVTTRWNDLFRAEQELILIRRAAGEPPAVSGDDGIAVLLMAERIVQSIG